MSFHGVPRGNPHESWAKRHNGKVRYNSTGHDMRHAIQTNATLLNQAWCDFIKAHDIKIGISLDGPAFIHDAHRKTRSGKGTHARTLQGMALLQEHDIDFRVIAVLTREALDYPDEMFQFFMHHGIRRIGFNIEEVEGINATSSLEAVDAEERYRAFMQRFYRLTKEAEGALEVREFEQIRDLILHSESVTFGQFTPFSILNIAHNGDFSTFSPELLSMPSQDYGDFVLGNIEHDTFESVGRSQKFLRMHRDTQAGVALCKRSCAYFSLCGGGAPANKYYENHSLRSSETMYCRFTRKALVDILLPDIESSLGLT
ncbi:MAG: GRRM system radical SAM/SPASM domain protein [Candidatus Tectomicrobia bacterium]|nr:GRRM system radical SAM/SPASM domain protein [Candidatus Tectomicrobia bacterium]